MEVSVSAALGHIETFMHPQVVITDDQSREDAFFTRAIRAKASELGKSVIELPKDAAEKMMWIARLDSGSLAGNIVSDRTRLITSLTILQPGKQPMSIS